MQHEISFFNADGEVAVSEVTKENGWDITESSAWCPKLKLGFAWELKQEAGRSILRIPHDVLREEGACKFKTIVPGQGEIAGREGDGGALVLPLDSGRLCHTKDKKAAEQWFGHFSRPAQWQVSWSNMSFVGQFAAGRSRAAIIEGAKFDAQLRVRTNWGADGVYVVDIAFSIRDHADEAPLAEDISLRYGEFPGEWRAIAKFYRDYIRQVRKVPSLAAKAKDNPDLDYSARAITVRCRMGIKPLPWVAEQTPETEPPVTVFMSFADIRKLADEFAKQKVGAAEFCLVGWGHGGHDGAFPQLFPVEEAFGGEAELRKTIKHVKALGYHISLHDNYYTVYTLATNLDPADICVKHDGSRLRWDDGDVLAGGIPYILCPRMAAEKYAPANFPQCAALGISGAYFADVISIIGMEKCHDKRHPVSRGGNADCYKRIMRMQQDYFKVSMSEGARDWALPELDRTYMVLNCVEVPFACVDELVPLYQIVHHGNIIYNNFREGINSFPGERLYLMNLAWGGLPMVYFHHLFHPDWKANSGWANDLTLETPEKLARDTTRIKRVTDDVAKLAPLRHVPIEDIVQHGEDLTQTLYANGTSVWANYADTTATTPDGRAVPPKDFIVVGGPAMA